MFIKITGTKNVKFCTFEHKWVRINDTQDIWILNTDYIVGISDRIINLSCYVEGAQKKVAYESEDTDTHSFYIPLYCYHTVETQIYPLDRVIKGQLFNRSKENDQ